jgi:hypothetical protein
VSDQESVHAINGRIGALESWARMPPAQRRRRTEAGRNGLLAKFEREADPDGVMDEADRLRAAESLLRAHMLRMVQIRQAKRRKEREKREKSNSTSSAK